MSTVLELWDGPFDDASKDRRKKKGFLKSQKSMDPIFDNGMLALTERIRKNSTKIKNDSKLNKKNKRSCMHVDSIDDFTSALRCHAKTLLNTLLDSKPSEIDEPDKIEKDWAGYETLFEDFYAFVADALIS